MLEKIGTIPAESGGSASLTVSRGWSNSLARKLTIASREPRIRSEWPEDMTERFDTVETANDWHEQVRPIVYSLSRTAELAAALWVAGNTTAVTGSDYEMTLRVYGKFRTQPIHAPFIRKAFDDFAKNCPDSHVATLVRQDDSKSRLAFLDNRFRIVKAEARGTTLYR